MKILNELNEKLFYGYGVTLNEASTDIIAKVLLWHKKPRKALRLVNKERQKEGLPLVTTPWMHF